MSQWPISRRTGWAVQTLTIQWPEHAWDAKPGDRVLVEVVAVDEWPYDTEPKGAVA